MRHRHEADWKSQESRGRGVAGRHDAEYGELHYEPLDYHEEERGYQHHYLGGGGEGSPRDYHESHPDYRHEYRPSLDARDRPYHDYEEGHQHRHYVEDEDDDYGHRGYDSRDVEVHDRWERSRSPQPRTSKGSREEPKKKKAPARSASPAPQKDAKKQKKAKKDKKGKKDK